MLSWMWLLLPSALRHLIQLCRVQATRYLLYYSLWMVSLTFSATLTQRQSISICLRSDNSFNDHREMYAIYLQSISHVSYLSDTIKLHALVTGAVLLVRLLFYPYLRNFNNWNSKWTNMLMSVSTAVFYSHTYVSPGRGTSRTCFSPHTREIVSWRFISVLQPLVYYFFSVYPLIWSRSQRLFALCISSTRPTLSPRFSLSVFSPRYEFSPPGEIQFRNKLHI